MEGKDYGEEAFEEVPDKDYPLIHYLTAVAM
jgi:PLU-1-like protein